MIFYNVVIDRQGANMRQLSDMVFATFGTLTGDRNFLEISKLVQIVNWRLYKLFRSRDMGRAVAVRRWTQTAVECYKRGCNCEGCFYKDFFSGSSQKCQMKASVLELVRVIGTPSNIEMQQFLED